MLIHKFLSVKVVLAFWAIVLVASFGVVSAQSVLQGYSSDEDLQKGMLVALKEGDTSEVVALSEKNSGRFKGVVVDKNDSPVTISDESHKLFVATTGPYELIVTDENGSIKKGDYISISSTAGIAAKANETQDFVIGVATGEFKGGGDSVGSTSKKANVGRILVDVNFGKNPGRKSTDNKVPAVLKKVSQTIADKPVSTIRIYLAVFIFIVSAAITGLMLYSGVRNTVVSIGRNPLSKGTIYRGLFQVVLLALIIFLVGLFGVYLILKL